jgi:hypothetical protein
LLLRRHQLQRDRAGPLADGGLAPVLDEAPAAGGREGAGGILGRVEVAPGEAHVGPEGAHALDLQGVRGLGGEHRQRQRPRAARVGHRLAEVAGAGAHQLPVARVAREEQLGAAALERADRVHRLDLEDQPHAQLVGQRLALELRRGEEHRIDQAGGRLDPLQQDAGLLRHRRASLARRGALGSLGRVAGGGHAPPLEVAMPLSEVELRVLGALVEKERTTPEAYPLSTQALVTACNQRTSRDPVTDHHLLEVRDAVQRLRDRGLAATVQEIGDRVPKHRHLLARAWTLDETELALLAVLILRGEQTAAELRARASATAGSPTSPASRRPWRDGAARPGDGAQRRPRAGPGAGPLGAHAGRRRGAAAAARARDAPGARGRRRRVGRRARPPTTTHRRRGRAQPRAADGLERASRRSRQRVAELEARLRGTPDARPRRGAGVAHPGRT